jgi:hypothetical protein
MYSACEDGGHLQLRDVTVCFTFSETQQPETLRHSRTSRGSFVPLSLSTRHEVGVQIHSALVASVVRFAQDNPLIYMQTKLGLPALRDDHSLGSRV